ncbi:MAG: hypothetical protein ACOY0T_22650 [Myxococcota bacterium]
MTSRCARWLERLASFSFEAVVVLAAVGCGDAQHSLGGVTPRNTDDPSAVPHVGRCAPGAVVDMIDNMEDGDGSIFLSHGRAGVWFSYNDETNKNLDTAQWPKAGAERFFMDPISPARKSSKRGARTRGAGYSNWGAGIGFDLLVQQPYDASHYEGITFFLRRSPGAASTVRFNVTDRNTSPLGGQCDANNNGCYSDFGFNLTATENWEEIKLSWSDLTQPSWALVRYPALETSALYGIRFQAEPNANFDFWIDDIAFLCGN